LGLGGGCRKGSRESGKGLVIRKMVCECLLRGEDFADARGDFAMAHCVYPDMSVFHPFFNRYMH